MKKLFIAFVAVACALCGCSDDDTTENGAQGATISITPDQIPTGGDGTTAQITVTSSADWRLAGVSDWVHPSAVSGRSGDVVTFVVDPNTTDDRREITYKFFTGAAVAPLTIVSEPGYRLELLTDSEVTYEAYSDALKVKLKTNIPELNCEFSDQGSEWVSFDGRSEAFGSTIMSFTVAKNPDYDNRSTVLTISGMNQAVEVTITQRQIDAINIENLTLEYDLAQRTIAVDVESNVNYAVQIGADWITQIESRGLVTKTLNFHLDEAATTRGGKITVTGAGIKKEISVIQKDPDAVAVTIPDDAFRNWLSREGWILDLGGGICVVTEAGHTATELVYNPGWRDDKIESLEGIGAFPELTRVDVSSNDLKVLDISELTQVNSLSCVYMESLSTILLGANPITEFAIYNGAYDYIYGTFDTLTIWGDKLVSLDVSMTGWYTAYDELKALDVSECPALETLDCRRGESLTTLYLKQGQVIPNLTKNDVTQIVYK